MGAIQKLAIRKRRILVPALVVIVFLSRELAMLGAHFCRKGVQAHVGMEIRATAFDASAVRCRTQYFTLFHCKDVLRTVVKNPAEELEFVAQIVHPKNDRAPGHDELAPDTLQDIGKLVPYTAYYSRLVQA